MKKQSNIVNKILQLLAFIAWLGLLAALHLYLSDKLKRVVVSFALSAYPIAITTVYFFNYQKIKQTSDVDYRKFIANIGLEKIHIWPFRINTTSFISALALSLMASVDFGMFLVFSVSIYLAWVSISIYTGRWKGRRRGLNVGNLFIWLLPFVLYWALLFYEGNGPKLDVLDKLSRTFHSRAISYFGREQEVAAKTSINAGNPGYLQLDVLQRAVQNRWFIENYKSQAPLTQGKILSHYSTGSNYETQLSDTLPVRFLIAEHGLLFALIPIALLLMLSVFPAASITVDINDNSGKNASNTFSLYFFLYALFFAVFDILINLNLFPFSGINYLIFSVNDSTFSISLLITIGCGILMMRKTIADITWRTVSRIAGFIGIAVLIFFGLYLPNLFVQKAGEYDFNNLVNGVKNEATLYNNALRDFIDTSAKTQAQRQRLLKLDATALIKRQRAASGPIVDSAGGYAAGLLENFITTNKYKRNPLQFLYIKKTDSIWQVSVNDFFFKRPPFYSGQKGALPEVMGYTNDTLANMAVSAGGAITPLSTFYKHTAVAPGTQAKVLCLPKAAFRRVAADDKDSHYMLFLSNADSASYLVCRQYTTAPPLTAVCQPLGGQTVVYQKNRAGGLITPFEIKWPDDKAFAKSYWVNGHYKYMYEKSNDGIYNYMMAENFKDASQKRVTLTFDGKLQGTLDSMLNKAYHGDTSIKTQASITCLDGDYKVRALAQSKALPDSSYINPNLLGSLTDFNLLLYYANEPNKLIQQRGLESTDKPGSTIKPFTYASVVSGFKADWETLELNDKNGYFKDKPEFIHEDEESNNYYAKTFAGKTTGNYLVDEWGNLKPSEFLARSRDLYHGLVIFLGSYTAEDLKNSAFGNEQNPSNPVVVRDAQGGYDMKHFPYFNYNGNTYYFNPDNWPTAGGHSRNYFGNRHSILSTQMEKNFNALSRYADMRDSGLVNQWYKNNLQDRFLTDSALFRDKLLPQPSWYAEDLREVKIGRGQRTSYTNGIRASFSGANVFNFSPLTLCKMGIDLYGLRNTSKLAFFESDTTGKQFSWKSDDYDSVNLLEKLRLTVFSGMYKSNADAGGTGPAGTAYSIFHGAAGNPLAFTKDGAINLNNHIFYLYTKTGTADETSQAANKQKRKNLLIIISSQNLHASNNFADFKKAKLYSIYVQLKYDVVNVKADWNPEDKTMVDEAVNIVMNSDSFKHYFGL